MITPPPPHLHAHHEVPPRAVDPGAVLAVVGVEEILGRNAGPAESAVRNAGPGGPRTPTRRAPHRDARVVEGVGGGSGLGVGEGDDEGYLVFFAYDKSRDGSDLVILDATRPQAGPVARVAMPRRVPFGFHGNWFADE